MPELSFPPDLVQAIAADLDNDAPRLVLADWLEQQGDTARAEFIRVQLELEPNRDRYEDPRAVALHTRERELYQRDWVGALSGRWQMGRHGPVVELRRGLPDTLLLTARDLLEQGAALRAQHPTLRRIVLFRVYGYGERLAACEALQGLAELELACWYSNEDAVALARSEHLSSLKVLVLWLARAGEDDEELGEIMADGSAWPQLERLVLVDPDGEHPGEDGREELLQCVNEAAGREIAVYERGYPETFPFAPDYWYVYPGRLPDGRMCLAREDAETEPPTLCVLTFDADGRQTDEILRAPLPEPLLSVPPSNWWQHKELVQKQLVDRLGFQPAFIRIRDCTFPGDNASYDTPHRGHEEWWEELGLPDDDSDEEMWEEAPWGSGGRIYGLVTSGEYDFGWDRWADKRGRVHST